MSIIYIFIYCIINPFFNSFITLKMLFPVIQDVPKQHSSVKTEQLINYEFKDEISVL